ncbi:MAG: hypothetical protein QM763_23375 [Agriterribacter sp.]
MKKTDTNRENPKPRFKWQTGAYARHTTYRLILPDQFLMLCRLTDTHPRDIIIDFMDNLACDSWKRKARDMAKEHLINYFIAHGYGQQHYTEPELRTMFKEMDAMGMLFPRHGKMKMIDLYAKWRKKQHHYWFKKWFRKPKPKLPHQAEP